MSEIRLPVCVRLIKNGEVLVKAELENQVIRLEGYWYFHPSLIEQKYLKVTDRLYACPYKGTCNWVDYEFEKTYLPDVAWMYPETLPEYAHIAGWYGFYTSTEYYKTGDCEE